MSDDIYRYKIEDLVESLEDSNISWNAWQIEFIESMGEKLEFSELKLSQKQKDKLLDLWEKYETQK